MADEKADKAGALRWTELTFQCAGCKRLCSLSADALAELVDQAMEMGEPELTLKDLAGQIEYCLGCVPGERAEGEVVAEAPRWRSGDRAILPNGELVVVMDDGSWDGRLKDWEFKIHGRNDSFGRASMQSHLHPEGWKPEAGATSAAEAASEPHLSLKKFHVRATWMVGTVIEVEAPDRDAAAEVALGVTEGWGSDERWLEEADMVMPDSLDIDPDDVTEAK